MYPPKHPLNGPKHHTGATLPSNPWHGDTWTWSSGVTVVWSDTHQAWLYSQES